jgi:hypothetical protein
LYFGEGDAIPFFLLGRARCRAAEAVHDGDAEAGFADGFGDDFIDAGFVEGAQDVEEADGGFGEFAAAGAEGFDVVPFVEVHVGAVVIAGVAEEGVAAAVDGVEVLRFP